MNESDFISGLLDTPAAREKIREIVREEIANYIMRTSESPDEELTVSEVAKLKRVSKRTVYDWVSKNLISVRRTPGGGLRFKRRDVEKM